MTKFKPGDQVKYSPEYLAKGFRGSTDQPGYVMETTPDIRRKESMADDHLLVRFPGMKGRPRVIHEDNLVKAD